MNRFTQFFCNLMVLGVALALTTPALAGPSMTATPTPIPTATPTATPTVTPTPCTDRWRVSRICVYGVGQSPINNLKITMCIHGRIVDPNRLGFKAHRIRVCQGEPVTVVVTDLTGTPTVTAGGSLLCESSSPSTATCKGVVNVTEKFKVVSSDGRDTDRMVLLPE